MARSSRTIQLAILGSALALAGCDDGAACKLGPDGKPLPLPDGSPNLNCSRSNSRHYMHGGAVFYASRGGGAAVGSTPVVTTGGFGSTGGSGAGISS